MQTYTATAQSAARDSGGLFGGIGSRLRSVEGWLDRRGRGAWIAAMVVSFVVFWPLGLFFVFYMTATNRWSRTMFGQCASRHRHTQDWHMAHRVSRPSGNTAFDAYKAETLRRLEEEQDAFEAFLDRLRAAKDKGEFDAFMDERAKGVKAEGENSPRGEY